MEKKYATYWNQSNCQKKFLHCTAHVKDIMEIDKGNTLANAHANAAARQPLRQCMMTISLEN